MIRSACRRVVGASIGFPSPRAERSAVAESITSPTAIRRLASQVYGHSACSGAKM
jgi:hypothetical protein